MTTHLPEDLTNSIRAEVLRGHFASEEEIVAAAVRDSLRRRQGQARPTDLAAAAGRAEEESSTQQLQRRLFEAGVLSVRVSAHARQLQWRRVPAAR